MFYSLYTTARLYCPFPEYRYKLKNYQECHPCNMSVSKDLEKVVSFVDIEDIGDKAVFCRCWRSKKVSDNFSVFDHLICKKENSHHCMCLRFA